MTTHSKQILTLAAWLALSTAPLAAQVYPLAPACGGEGERACHAGDYGFHNNYLWHSAACETDLANIGGICRNLTRQILPKDTGWVGWAAAQQMYQIAKDVPINRIAWLSSHNAYSNARQGFTNLIYRNNILSITDLLQLGARHLELDPHTYDDLEPNGPVRLCHASNTLLCYASGYETRLFANALREIDNWLSSNPGEVIVIKLDEKVPPSRFGRMYQEIEAVLGPKLYPIHLIVGWPTMAQIRGAGKQILFVQHNQTIVPNQSVWPGKNAFQANNWPINQDFGDCVGRDGHTALTRPISDWWDVAEGRSLSNIALQSDFPYEPYPQTGLMYEGEVARAVRCGVNLVGLDYLGALNGAFGMFGRSSPPDMRPKSMIWSWTDGDFGKAGPAMFRPRLPVVFNIFDPAAFFSNLINGNRWHSRPSSEVHPFVCGLKQGTGFTYKENRDWKITAQSYPWNKTVGDQMCAAQFGASYEFGFPTNGFQNEILGGIARGDVWLGYTVVQEPTLSVTPGNLTFRTAPGAPLPPAQGLSIAAQRGTALSIVSQSANWARLVLPSDPYVMPTETLNAQVELRPEAGSLPSGRHVMEVQLRGVLAGRTETVKIRVTLDQMGTASVVLTLGQSIVPQGQIAQGKVVVTSQIPGFNGFPTGSVKVYEQVVRPNGQPALETLTAGDLSTGGLPLAIANLPVGPHTLIADYGGDSLHEGGSSATVTLTVVPRIQANPSPISFSMLAGTQPPPQKTVTLSGYTTEVKLLPNCPWLDAFYNSLPTAILRPRSSVSELGIGQYNCQVDISDKQTQSGLGGGSIPVTLVVQTVLQATPAQFELIAAQKPAGRQVNVTAAGNAVVPISVETDQPWLSVILDQSQTPALMQVLADPTGCSVGTYVGHVNVRSPLANTVAVEVKLRVVSPVTVTTNPPGLQVIVNGTIYTAPAVFAWLPGSSNTLSSALLQGSADSRFRFKNWNGSPALTIPVITPANGGVYTAAYSPEYRVIGQAVPAHLGAIQATPASLDWFYPDGTQIAVTAVPTPGSIFAGWSGDLSGTAAETTLLVSSPKSFTAAFSPVPPIKASLLSNVTGARVNVDGNVYTVPVSLAWTPGSTHSIIALPPVSPARGTQWVFHSWSDGGAAAHTVQTPGADLALTATYRRQFLLTASASPQSGGTILSGGWFDVGAPAVVRAIPASGFRFTGFSGDLTGDKNPHFLVMNAPATVAANFAPEGAPNIYASSVGARTNGPGRDQRIIPLTLKNVGAGGLSGCA